MSSEILLGQRRLDRVEHADEAARAGDVVDVDPHHGQQILCHGYTVLLSNADGSIDAGGRQGLFDYDTRVLSAYQILLDGVRPRVDSAGLLGPARWAARLTVPRTGGDARGPLLPQDALELTVRRRIGNGMAEEFEITNRSAVAVTTSFAIRLDADFCDMMEIGEDARPLGATSDAWDDAASTLTIDYRAAYRSRGCHRAIRVRVSQADSRPRVAGRSLTFDVRLSPGGCWRARLAYETLVDDRWRSPAAAGNLLSVHEGRAADWRRDRTHVESDPPSFGMTIERAADDLCALRNWEHEAGPDAWIPNAGIPTYTGLFGRDTLTAGWQAALVGPEMMRGAIARLAATQADTDSAWHDAEPGKMIHEMRRGPLSDLDVVPQRGYYGTQTSSSFFVVALSELWHWTGETEIVRTYLDAALRACEWARRYGDRDGDGFLEYEKRSPRGLKNHGWKDSDEAIRYPDGSLVANPIATVEEQAFHWLALLRLAEMLVVIGDDERAEPLLARAGRLRAAWHRAFWLEDEAFYAMALDPAKGPVRSIASNAGHALAAGLVPMRHARQVADRLMAPDLFSGWGVRTLSSAHVSYNPLAYHLGTVWPVENATFALGFKRYGFDRHVERLVTAMFDAAARFRYHRLPEALGGHSREESPIPTVYPASNSPQAWSASATIQMAQTLFGIYAFAPAHVLAFVRPTLPPGLKSVVIHNLRVGDARISIAFERDRDGATSYRTFDKIGTLHVVRAVPPQQAGRGGDDWQATLAAWLVEHAPGRLAKALRIALGEEA